MKLNLKNDYGLLGAVQQERRFAIDRRQFSYADYIPERRSGKDRRGSALPFRSHASSPFCSTPEEKWACWR